MVQPSDQQTETITWDSTGNIDHVNINLNWPCNQLEIAQFDYSIPISGDLQLDAVIDPDNDIIESDEKNNDKNISFTVNPAEKEEK